ncbi:MAG: hypothetical protein JNN08_26450, partial [Bryobacterales bacterium]|nr:hypothetical protein [Bryobacterales bacterium]
MTKGRLLFVGDLAPHCRTYQRYRAFSELGYEVEGVTSSPVDYQPGITPLSFRSRLFFKLRRPLDETGANGKLVEAAKRFRPDVIWVERALMIRRAAIEQAIAACDGAVKVFSYSEDDMFAPHNQSRYYLDCLPKYDVVFTTKSYNCRPE